MYENMKKSILNRYNGEYIRFMDYSESKDAYYVRFIYHSTIYLCEKRVIGGSTKFYKMEG